MRSFRLASIELKRLAGEPMARAALVAVACVPLLYGALYLWAFWNPYGNLDKLPVALVNDDVPATSAGGTVSAGSDLAHQLLQHGDFAWHSTSWTEAREGLSSGRYYLALVIPRDFSASLATANSDEPRRAQLRVYARESQNMLAGMIGERAFAEVRAAASANASKRYLDHIFIGFADSHGRLTDAAAGARTLSDGLASARSGASTLARGTATAHAGARSLAAGLGQLENGSSALSEGARRVASGTGSLSAGLTSIASGAGTLSGSAAKLSSGADKLDAGVSSAVSQLGQASAGAGQVRDGAVVVDSALHAYLAEHPEAAGDSAFATALGASAQVKAGSAQVANGLAGAAGSAPALVGGAHAVAAGAHKLAAGAARLAGATESADACARTLASATGSLARGSAAVDAGAAGARHGARALASGVARLDGGAHTLASGLAPAASGSRQLAAGLRTGAAALPAYTATTRSRNAAMMSDPVALATDKIDPVPNYGTGFTPYFLPLALWIGALMAYFIVRPLPQRALATGTSPLVAALAGYWPAALLALVQTALLVAVLHITLGLAPVNPIATLGIAALAALVFVALLQFLAAAFGPVGKLLSIILLMLQLTSCAGTFPIQTVPGFFQAVSPYLPMTYVVAALRASVSGGDPRAMLLNAVIIAAFGLLGLAGTVVAAARKRTWTMDRLRPSFDI